MSLLSLVLPSCIIVPKEELVNISNISSIKPQENILKPYKHHTMDVEDNLSRGHSISPSNTSQRNMSTSSAAFLIDYIEQVQTQSTKETWTDQVQNGDTQKFSHFHTPMESAFVESIGEYIQMPHNDNTNYIVSLQG